jgi:hypothetical protein
MRSCYDFKNSKTLLGQNVRRRSYLETAVERFQDSDSDATATGGRERRAVGQQQPPERNNNNNFNNNNNNGGAVGREEERRLARTTTLVRKAAVPCLPFNNFFASFKYLIYRHMECVVVKAVLKD